MRKRLATIGRSQSFIDWRGVRRVADDLDTQRQVLVEKVAKADPKEALELLWRFMALATSIFERSDEGSGTIIGVFHDACENIGEVAVLAKVDPVDLADRAYEALVVNDYGQYDGLIGIAAPSLGPSGLEHLKRCMIALSNEPVQRLPEKERCAIGYGSGGPICEDEMAERSRQSTVNLALEDIADAQRTSMPSSPNLMKRPEGFPKSLPRSGRGFWRPVRPRGRWRSSMRRSIGSPAAGSGRTLSGRTCGSMPWKLLDEPMTRRMSGGTASNFPCHRPISERT